MNRTRLLGIDYGSVRIGLAVSDPDRRFAFPLEIYQRRNADADAAYFRTVIEREEIGSLVIGLPVHLSGDEGAKAREVRQFAEWIKKATGLEATFYDERFTTVQAESALWNAGLTHKRRKERRDKVAAQMLLQAYLDAGCPEDTTPGPLEG